jgi:low temperature requirement protein LtrA
LTVSLLAAVVLGLALAAAMWWAYFDGDDARAEHSMMRADPVTRAGMGVYGYYYAHLLMISGIVIAAAGMQPALAESAHVDPADAGPTTTGWLLSAGVALYLVGGAAFRMLLRIGTPWGRLAAAAVALALAPLGAMAGSAVHLSAVVLVLTVMLLAERRAMHAGVLTPHPE